MKPEDDEQFKTDLDEFLEDTYVSTDSDPVMTTIVSVMIVVVLCLLAWLLFK